MKKKTVHIYIAFVNAVIVLLLGYCISNIPSPLGGEIPYLVKHVGMKQSLNAHKKIDAEPFLFVNTCYDIDTIPHLTDGVADGYQAITSRCDLLTFLRHLKNSNNYKYIFLDIRLNKLPNGYNFCTDSLVAMLSSMERIVIAQSKTYNLADDILDSIAGGVDYIINETENNFFKFSIIQDGIPSMPLRAYQNMNHHTIQAHMNGLFFTEGWHLCRKTIIPVLTMSNQANSLQDGRNHISWSYVNLDEMTNACFGNLYQDKIIVIGDLFLHDMHDTYVGSMAGPVINANIYANLESRRHLIQWKEIVGLGAFYVILFLLVVYLDEKVNKNTRPNSFWGADIVKVLLSFVEAGVVFNLLAYITYLCNGSIINVWFPIIWFTVIPKVYLAIYDKKYE